MDLEKERAQQYLDLVGSILLAIDSDHKITLLNRKGCEVLGCRAEDALGRDWFDTFVPERLRTSVVTVFDQLMRGEIEPVEYFENPVVTAAGDERLIAWRNTVLKDEKGNISGTLSSGADVTDRRQAENRLREQEERLDLALRGADLGTWDWNVQTGEVIFNERWARMLGYGVTEIEPHVRSWKKLVHPDEMPRIETMLAEHLAGKTPFYETEYRLRHKSGEWIWVLDKGKVITRDADGTPLRACGTHLDITERRRIQEALRESEARYRTLFEESAEGILVADIETRQVKFANPAICKMLGYSRQEVEALRIADIYPEVPLDSAFPGDGVSQVGEGSREADVPCLRKDGTTIYANISTARVRVDETECSVSALSDITEIKRLRELESRARRLETAGQIAGQVAHDFNNLLAPLMAYPDFVRSELPKNHPALPYLSSIERAAARIADVNQQLLTLGRRGHYNHEVLNLNEIVLQAVKELDLERETMTCEVDLCRDLMNVKGGSAQLHRVVSNLLCNARDALQDIGSIFVATENYYVDEMCIAHGRVPKGEYVKLTIADTGCGIPDDIVDKVLDPFFTSKTTDRKRGSGLGLTIVDAVIKDHCGYLDLSTTVGQGTSCYLYFPVSREQTAEVASEQIRGGTETVLIVDDDEDQREVSEELLERLGYKVSVVASGEEAVEHLKENPHDLLVLDMVMSPGIDGAETYRRVLQTNPFQKAIIMSGFSETERIVEAQKLGAGAFVKKPVTMMDIAAAVRTELERKVKSAVDDG